MGGGDKTLRPLAGRRVIDHVLERLRPQVPQMALNANGDPARFAAFDLPVIADSMAEFPGPLAGVLAGMDWAAAEGAEHILTVAADTPFFPADLQARLSAAREAAGAPIALATTPGPDKIYRHPTFGLWPVALREDLRRAFDGRSCVKWFFGPINMAVQRRCSRWIPLIPFSISIGQKTWRRLRRWHECIWRNRLEKRW
jgi:molybdopterin-guanine dinucleotide biosynthesis protein A